MIHTIFLYICLTGKKIKSTISYIINGKLITFWFKSRQRFKTCCKRIGLIGSSLIRST